MMENQNVFLKINNDDEQQSSTVFLGATTFDVLYHSLLGHIKEQARKVTSKSSFPVLEKESKEGFFSPQKKKQREKEKNNRLTKRSRCKRKKRGSCGKQERESCRKWRISRWTK